MLKNIGKVGGKLHPKKSKNLKTMKVVLTFPSISRYKVLKYMMIATTNVSMRKIMALL